MIALQVRNAPRIWKCPAIDRQCNSTLARFHERKLDEGTGLGLGKWVVGQQQKGPSDHLACPKVGRAEQCPYSFDAQLRLVGVDQQNHAVVRAALQHLSDLARQPLLYDA